eukprot:6305669-Ditylum_brightwellii.AAC.2
MKSRKKRMVPDFWNILLELDHLYTLLLLNCNQNNNKEQQPPSTKSATWRDWFGSFIGLDETKNRSTEIAVTQPPTAGCTANLGPVHYVSTSTERPTVLSLTTSADENNKYHGLLVRNTIACNTSEQQ